MNRVCYSAFIASIAAMVGFAIGVVHIENNLMTYISCLCCYMVCFWTVYFLPIRQQERKTKYWFILGIVSLITMMVFSSLYLINSRPFYGYEAWTILPKWVVIGIVFLTSFQVFNLVYMCGGGVKIPAACCRFI